MDISTNGKCEMSNPSFDIRIEDRNQLCDCDENWCTGEKGHYGPHHQHDVDGNCYWIWDHSHDKDGNCILDEEKKDIELVDSRYLRKHGGKHGGG